MPLSGKSLAGTLECLGIAYVEPAVGALRQIGRENHLPALVDIEVRDRERSRSCIVGFSGRILAEKCLVVVNKAAYSKLRYDVDS